jgi:hypothetical protein
MGERAWLAKLSFQVTRLLIFSVRHRDECGAVEVDPDNCTCAPVVYVTTGERGWTRLGVLYDGWTRETFARLVTCRP